ncbi:FADD protein, partial [Trogon melanurus]|nr:FADD protein [Trogon melanurus]
MDPFLALQLSISQRLSDGELHQLKFLCQVEIGKRKLESVQSALELFSICVEQQLFTEYDLTFLEYLLESIKRKDLISQVKQFHEEREVTNPDDEPDEREKPFEVICENVGRDWRWLMRELQFPEVRMERIVAAHPLNLREQLFQSLREWQKWKGKDAKVTDLIRALRCCNMNLVADLVER